MQLIDTHAHIHHSPISSDLEKLYIDAKNNNISTIINIGTDYKDSVLASEYCNEWNAKYDIEMKYTIGLHPHDASKLSDEEVSLEGLLKSDNNDLVAIGEFGLDFYYNNSSKDDQQAAIRTQLEWCKKYNLPAVFHIRSAIPEFLEIYREYSEVRGVIHSFSDNYSNAKRIVDETNLYIALNGIMTFSKDEDQLKAAKYIPLSRLVLETDSPFLSPKPHRGKPNTPSYVLHVAEFLSELRDEPIQELCEVTTLNAKELFSL